jgi:DNA-binding NtrC family response regulator
MTELQKRILVVDDCDDIRANFADILQEFGYCVDQAPDGPSALALIRQHSYAVALLDYVMPGMNGAEVANELKRLQPQAVAIMITAHPGTVGGPLISNVSIPLLRKPVELTKLLPLVADAFAATHARQSDPNREQL